MVAPVIWRLMQGVPVSDMCSRVGYLFTAQALCAALTQQEVPQAVRKQIALSLARLRAQAGDARVGQLLGALPPDQARELAELTSQPLIGS